MAFLVPFSRDEYFSGRLSILEGLKNSPTVTVLHGPSRVGKTHIAMEYAYRHKTVQPGSTTIWLSAHGFWRLNASIQRLTSSLSIPIEMYGFASFSRWLTGEQHDQWLLILDDLSFESFPEHQRRTLLDFLSNFSPQFGRILITTKVDPQILLGQDFDSSAWQATQVETFPESELELMMKVNPATTKWTHDDISDIIAISQGSASMLQFLIALWQESQGFEEQEKAWETLTKHSRKQSPAQSQDEALSIALDQVKRESVEAYEVLCFASLLDVQGIPATLLSEIWSENHRRSTLRLRRCLRKLESFALIRLSTEPIQVFMNEPMKLLIHHRLEQGGELSALHQKAIEILEKMFVLAPTVRRLCEDLMPHIRQALKDEPTAQEDKSIRLKLLLKLGKFDISLSMYQDAEKMFQSALDLQMQESKGDDLRTLEIKQEIAGLLLEQEKLDEASDYHKSIEEAYHRILPPNDYRLLMHSGDYGLVFLAQSQWAEAERRLLEGLEGAQKIYGPSNGKVLGIQYEIARLCFLKGSYEDAHVKFEEVLEQYQLQYDDSEPHVFQTMEWIARTLKALDKPQESVDLYRKAVILASSNPQVNVEFVLQARGNLAVALSEMGNLSEAADEQRKIIELYQLIEPQPSIHVIQGSLNLGVTLERLSRYEDSCKVLEKASGDLVQAGLTETHPTALRIRNSLALGYLRLGQFSKGEEMYHNLIKAQVALHPDEPKHADILLVKNNLGGALQRQERYAEAIEIQQEVFDSAMKLGPGNRTTLFAGTNLAESFRMLAETGVENREELLDKAETMHRTVLAERERQFGEMWQTWISRINIGMVLQAKDQLEDAVTWYKDLDALEEVVGGQNWTVMVGRGKWEKLPPSVRGQLD